ncbi:male-enhanced antigen 1-like isoform X2 [Acanthaster planci]|nr:male-enhanced antigen 1-like isoform X2 [Acanthaster planci]XP_022083473.1 male-enhanced antigen 1-like isoform X2 [Acanthaster planci]XP_022083474.1 male-enhanced antigen 1-like isoform X2 [Acanthaster planci]
MPQVVIAMGNESNEEDDSDEEGTEEGAGPQGDGYMLLPEADQELDFGENEAVDDGACAAAPSNQQQQQQQPVLPAHLAKLLPAQPPARDPSTVVSFADTTESLEDRRRVMAADDEIRKAMAGFSLPGTAIPPWARALGDNEWKEQLTKMIRGREEKRHDSGGTPRGGKT